MKNVPELPEGVGAMYHYTPTETICILYKARGPHTNKLPESNTELGTPLAVGVAFLHPNDMEKYSPLKGEVIALGRALKMYNAVHRPCAYNPAWGSSCSGQLTYTIK